MFYSLVCDNNIYSPLRTNYESRLILDNYFDMLLNKDILKMSASGMETLFIVNNS